MLGVEHTVIESMELEPQAMTPARRRVGGEVWISARRRIGIDEISYRSQRYLLVIVDHDAGRLVWAGKNRTGAALRWFFDDPGADRATQLTHVFADGAQWIHDVVTARAPRRYCAWTPFTSWR